MLELIDVHAGYGAGLVLRGVNLTVQPGEIVALLGRNGSGRSTTLKAIMGLVPATGQVCWQGQPLAGFTPFDIARAGLGYVPESRDIFPTLTVHENLVLGQKPKAMGTPVKARSSRRWSFDEAYHLFPQLKARQHTAAGVLSGGEQQMLSLSRTLMGEPDLVLIDEPTEGLAPQLVKGVADSLLALRALGLGVLLVEQKLDIALDVADRCLVMGHGAVVFEGGPDAIRAAPALRREWLEV